MLKLASLCFPDKEKSCFFCCPPIRDPQADPLDHPQATCNRLRRNRQLLQINLEAPREIPGDSCWGLGFLDEQEKQAGCLLHPSRHQGRDLRHLTGYQFKCANALCREAQVFGQLTASEQRFLLALCRDMNSLEYASRRNPLMQILAWEEEVIRLILRENRFSLTDNQADIAGDVTRFLSASRFLRLELDFRLDACLVAAIGNRSCLEIISGQTGVYIDWRNALAQKLNQEFKPRCQGVTRPVHQLKISLSLSRFLKFGADLWELENGVERRITTIIDSAVDEFLTKDRLAC